MTREEIAEVRETYTGKSSSEAQLFIRLLDEREALLEALKRATDAIAGEWGDSSAADLRAVIAKAES